MEKVSYFLHFRFKCFMSGLSNNNIMWQYLWKESTSPWGGRADIKLQNDPYLISVACSYP